MPKQHRPIITNEWAAEPNPDTGLPTIESRRIDCACGQDCTDLLRWRVTAVRRDLARELHVLLAGLGAA